MVWRHVDHLNVLRNTMTSWRLDRRNNKFTLVKTHALERMADRSHEDSGLTCHWCFQESSGYRMPECMLQGKIQTSASCIPSHKEWNSAGSWRQNILHLEILLQPVHWVAQRILTPSGTFRRSKLQFTYTHPWSQMIWWTHEAGGVSGGIRLQVNH